MWSFLKFSFIIFVVSTVSFILFNLLLARLNPRIGQLVVNVSNQKAKVFVDGELVGTTPLYSKTLPLGDRQIKIESANGAKFFWETSTTLTKSTVSTIDLDLGPNKSFSAGESLYFQPGDKTLTIISRPEGAVVTIDKKERGRTPLTLSLETGVHQLVIGKEGYLDREIPINIEPDYKLSAVVYLALNPFEGVSKVDSNNKISLFLLSNSKKDLSRNIQEWVDGIVFTQEQFNPVQTKFDVLIDLSGKLYILNKTEWENKKASKSVSNVGYLAKPTEKGLSTSANETWVNLKNEFN